MSSELTRRILFGVIAAPIAIAILLVGGAPLAALLAIAAPSARGSSSASRARRGLTPMDNVGNRHRRPDPAARARALPPALRSERPVRPSVDRRARHARRAGARRSGRAASTESRSAPPRPRCSARRTRAACSASAMRFAITSTRSRRRTLSLRRRARSAVPSGGLLLLLPVLRDLGVGHRRVRRWSHDGTKQAHPVGEPRKNGRGRDRRIAREHARRVAVHAVSPRPDGASRLPLSAGRRAAVRRAGQRRRADRRPRRVAAQARGRREGQLAHHPRPRRNSRSFRQPVLRDARGVRAARRRCSPGRPRDDTR